MTDTAGDAVLHVQEMHADLSRLIEALDRRVPHLERLGEVQIARDAGDLRQRAVDMMRKLERAPSVIGKPSGSC
jgi:hypothetical protein